MFNFAIYSSLAKVWNLSISKEDPLALFFFFCYTPNEGCQVHPSVVWGFRILHRYNFTKKKKKKRRKRREEIGKIVSQRRVKNLNEWININLALDFLLHLFFFLFWKRKPTSYSWKIPPEDEREREGKKLVRPENIVAREKKSFLITAFCGLVLFPSPKKLLFCWNCHNIHIPMFIFLKKY